MKGWILVTGGVASGIGKGVAATMIGRRLARAHGPVDYRKVEPCLQTELRHLPNSAFGEIVQSPGGHWFDADVARAAFWIPGFQPGDMADTSLGHIAPHLPENSASPRLVGRLAEVLGGMWPAVERRVVEVGGTAGEPEHGLVVRGLLRAFGRPALHVHVTTLVQAPGGRWTSKPAQFSLDALPVAPDLVCVRGSGSADTLAAHIGRVPVFAVEDEPWAEAAWHRALQGWPALAANPDPVLERHGTPDIAIDVVSDVGLEAYDSLRTRLFTWTGGRAILARGGAPLRIGETPPPKVSGAFCIVPVEQGNDPRDPRHRPDWHGTADAPEGALAEWLRALPAASRSAVPVLPYTLPDWASVYIEHSQDGRLRDHRVLDDLLRRSLPAPLAGRRVLDIGCGDGRLAARLIGAGAKVSGVEPSGPMAAAAEARGLPGFRVHRAAAEDFRIDGLVDVAIAWMSLDHTAALDIALANIARALRPGGRLIACTEHALRSAPRDGQRWGPDAARVRDYVDPGWRTFHWFGRAEGVPVHHVPLGAWVHAARRAGLLVGHLAEPAGEGDHGVPRFQFFVFEKPSPGAPLVTIDGPAGSGKSTLGREVAARLAFHMDAVHLDTGRLHRTLALRSLRGGRIERGREGGDVVWLLDGADPSTDLDRPEVLERCALVDDTEVVAELDAWSSQVRVVTGRGWGRALPATLRLWLDTPLDLRAARRGVSVDHLRTRDERDRARGRLLEPDLCAVVLDGRRGVSELVDQVVRALGR